MKRFFYISACFIALTIFAHAQNTTGARVSRGADRNTNAQQKADSHVDTPALSVRAQRMNEQLTQEIGNARWIRNIMRELDLKKEKNAPIYFPVQELNGMKNLFTTLFQLISEEKIKVYKYLPDYDSFEDDNILTFKELLDKNKIYYDEVPISGNRPVYYAINSSDIPSRDVIKMFVKEAWYFDQNNSVYDVKTLAICPIIFITMDSGEELLEGMFWVKYEDIRPYIINNKIMTSSINNAKTYTMDDFFRLRMYDGDIIQTENLQNLPLVKLFDTDEEMYAEQQRIELQLKSFNDSLWIQPDTAAVVLSKKEAKKVSSSKSSSQKTSGKESSVSAGSKTTSKSTPKEKAPKQQKAPTEKATKSSPTRSIRR